MLVSFLGRPRASRPVFCPHWAQRVLRTLCKPSPAFPRAMLAGRAQPYPERGQARSPQRQNGINTGKRVKLQLPGRDAPYYWASNGVFTSEASNATVTLPTR
jgi:hypothetical protein